MGFFDGGPKKPKMENEITAEVNLVGEQKIQAPEFCVKLGDFIANSEDWTDADLIFVNATCFMDWNPDDLMHQLSKKMHKLKKGTWIMTTTHPLPNCAKADERAYF